MKDKILLVVLSIVLPLLSYGSHPSDAVMSVYESLTKEQQAMNPEISIGVFEENQWLVMVDLTPLANWGHEVTYYYLPKNGNDFTILKTEVHNFPPEIPLTKMFTHPTPNYSPIFNSEVPKRDVPSAENQYAIIISGGICDTLNERRY